jgi:Cu(I)/Ag(I) efflux system membrane fusion protein
VSPGTAVDPATELLTIADLSSVWIIAEVSERDIPHITAEMPAIVDIPAARASIQTQVDFVYPTVSERTRSLRIRIVIPNENRFFRPGMTAAVTLRGHARAALTIPRDAVVDTGEEQHVFVVTGPGAYEPRTVRVGITTDSRIEILEGLNENEHVLSSGVFLIDSESRLRGSGGGVGHGAHGSAGEVAPADENPHQGHGE